LDFSKVESGRLDIEAVDFSLHDNVTDLYRLLIPSAMQKGLSLEYSGSIPKDLHVLGDPSRIRQILLNILTNALKFTKKGSVKLTSKITPIFDGQDELKATFIVEDTGIGIEKHVLDRLFQPFRQGDSSTARLYGGTGLGLAISKNVSISSIQPSPFDH
jgi:signal transduction histidine kinase